MLNNIYKDCKFIIFFGIIHDKTLILQKNH